MSFEEWAIPALITAVTTLAGGMVALWRVQLKIHAEQLSTHAKIRDDLSERNAELETKINALSERCALLERENQRLLSQFVIFSSSHDSSPLPQWVKDEDGKVLAVNRAYERLFLLPRGYNLQDYQHHTDAAVWPPEIAQEFRENDQLVWRTRRVHDLLENVAMPNGETRKMRIIKYPRYADGIEEPIGIAGIAIPERITL